MSVFFYLYWIGGIFIISYFTNIYYLQRYIYRKIKLIYKTIREERLMPHEKNTSIDMNSNIIDDVEREVAEWAANQRKEIDKYKSWASYRRQFLGDISHELKTPIFNIQGYLHTLLDGGLRDETINVSFLEKAATNVERLNTIVDDLESIARLESEELILEMQVFDIKKLTEEVFDDMEMKAASKQIALSFKEGAAQGYKVRADRESIRQVMMNLVSNSIKYGKADGRTKLSFYDMDRYILVEVSDNGIGISKEHLKHIFDRFYRVDKHRSRDRGGSGLGLAIVKHIVEAHKQTIHVRSTPNIGTTFGFTLEKA
jgi:two-component system phosphate regulon sensor histidine kinase PhoR